MDEQQQLLKTLVKEHNKNGVKDKSKTPQSIFLEKTYEKDPSLKSKYFQLLSAFLTVKEKVMEIANNLGITQVKLLEPVVIATQRVGIELYHIYFTMFQGMQGGKLVTPQIKITLEGVSATYSAGQFMLHEFPDLKM